MYMKYMASFQNTKNNKQQSINPYFYTPNTNNEIQNW
jgi:hypothetical protein